MDDSPGNDPMDQSNPPEQQQVHVEKTPSINSGEATPSIKSGEFTPKLFTLNKISVKEKTKRLPSYQSEDSPSGSAKALASGEVKSPLLKSV